MRIEKRVKFMIHISVVVDSSDDEDIIAEKAMKECRLFTAKEDFSDCIVLIEDPPYFPGMESA